MSRVIEICDGYYLRSIVNRVTQAQIQIDGSIKPVTEEMVIEISKYPKPMKRDVSMATLNAILNEFKLECDWKEKEI